MPISEDDCTGDGANPRRCSRLWTRSGQRGAAVVCTEPEAVSVQAKAPRGAQRFVLQRSVLLEGRDPRVPPAAHPRGRSAPQLNANDFGDTLVFGHQFCTSPSPGPTGRLFRVGACARTGPQRRIRRRPSRGSPLRGLADDVGARAMVQIGPYPLPSIGVHEYSVWPPRHHADAPRYEPAPARSAGVGTHHHRRRPSRPWVLRFPGRARPPAPHTCPHRLLPPT